MIDTMMVSGLGEHKQAERAQYRACNEVNRDGEMRHFRPMSRRLQLGEYTPSGC